MSCSTSSSKRKCPIPYVYYCFYVLETRLKGGKERDLGWEEFRRRYGVEEGELGGIGVDDEYPLFVTWNKYTHPPPIPSSSKLNGSTHTLTNGKPHTNGNGTTTSKVKADEHDDDDEDEDDDESNKSLRGCIGTFSPMELGEGLNEYALIAALKDSRFRPITADELPYLECGVSLLTPMNLIPHPLAWTPGLHGIHITFRPPTSSRKVTATYLPEVTPAQNWTKEEALLSLLRKGGYKGKVGKVGGKEWEELGVEVRVYESWKGRVGWGGWEEWKKTRGASVA